MAREIATCHSSLGGEFGERIDSVKDASQKGVQGTPVAGDGLWLAPAEPVLP